MTTHFEGFVAIGRQSYGRNSCDAIMLSYNTDQIEVHKHNSGANQNTIHAYVNHLQSGKRQYVWEHPETGCGHLTCSHLSYFEGQRFTIWVGRKQKFGLLTTTTPNQIE